MILEIFRLAYEHPWDTALLILCLAILISEFHPVVVIKKYDVDMTKKEEEDMK